MQGQCKDLRGPSAKQLAKCASYFTQDDNFWGNEKIKMHRVHLSTVMLL